MNRLLIVISDNDERAARLMGFFEHTAEIFGATSRPGYSRLDGARAGLEEGVRLTKRVTLPGSNARTEFIAEAVKLMGLEGVAYQIKTPGGSYDTVIRVGEPGGM